MEKIVECTDYGWRVTVYCESTNKIGYWFGTRRECENIRMSQVTLYDMEVDDRPDDFDLACERKYD